ncbi:accessory factor UbiK family protein [Neptunomonas phycophila]|uniref:Ubiquinone biosynthesis accessory factor UbiK n=1 Tax=Neptunomonas phycophila TaxID=1572645 RepID=A0AAW7XHC1_9GAMM|nr:MULTISPECIES: accessory factor UbiK family protein [Neptunomonas]MBT3145373.1 accessory factor UbiK family protein [Neptunomonas phycophila]MDN2659080.1 accessory factor UbiK family protein [Neptunomonas sp. CHC150]MDO6453621.1 accessory factor UbiK family protein [Neptunomonas phycophila]MDO6468227.1 accessory factor UbiK family protein [Neptunomonas phycophila]MDP2522236.1 accessory factor UbiK family protein [Neptunomonas phycophila]
MNEKLIDNLSSQFSQMLNTFNNGAELPGQQQMRALLQSALSKMDLVTREEFDAQSAVLARTREKVDALEKVVAEIQVQLESGSDTSTEK